MVFMEQLAVLCLLAIVGEPLRNLISIRIDLLKSLDVFQILILDFYLGGFVFYVIALIPLHLFSRYITILILVTSSIISLFLLSRKYLGGSKFVAQSILKRVKQVYQSKTRILMGLLLVLFFLVVLWMEVEAVRGILFGNICDASMFSTLATLISRNEMIPATFSPFDSAGIIYPQAFTVIQVFAAYVFNAEPATMIVILVPLFQALIVFAAYFLGKLWFGKTSHGLLFAVLFAFVSRWPKLLVWGSYAFVAAFPLYFVVLGFVGIAIRKTGWQKRQEQIIFLLLGLLIGYLGAIHVAFYEIIFTTLFLLGIYWIVTLRRESWRKLSLVFLMFASSLLPVSLFLYRFVASANLPGGNIGLPTDIIASPLLPYADTSRSLLEAFFVNDWISPYPDLKIVTIFIIVFSLLALLVFRKHIWANCRAHIVRAMLVSVLGVGLTIALTAKELGLSLISTAINSSEMAILSYISIILLAGIGLATLFDKINTSFGVKSHMIARSIITFLLLMILFSPFAYSTIAEDVLHNRWTWNHFSVTTPDDYQLMLNMKDELPITSIILINPYDAGEFIPSIAGYRIIYPYGGSQNSISYNHLCSLILKKNLNETAFALLNQYNITHLFVGARAYNTMLESYLGRQEWDPMLFLGNPNFNLFSNVNNSYLFAFTPQNSNAIFFEDFENFNPYHNGWKTETEIQGNGTANIALSSDPRYRFDGNNSLKLSAKGFPNASSTIWFSRTLYLPNSEKNAYLSFYLDSPVISQDLSRSIFYLTGENWTQQISSLDGFQNNQGLTIIISDENLTQHLSITTWDKNDSIKLLCAPGSYHIDLSSLWLTKFETPLPSRFLIKIEQFSSDGKESVFYLDSIGLELAANPIVTLQKPILESGP